MDTRPVPRAHAGTVLCRVKYAGLNPVDAKFVMGDKFAERYLPAVRWAVEGRTVGFDFSGEVVEAPSGSPFRGGDAVWGTVPPLHGSLSEFVAAPTDQIARKPTDLSFAEAAALPLVGLTSLEALEYDHHLTRGQRLLILGASGGVGHVAVQVAKAIGARVTAVCSAKNAPWVASLGADEVIDYTNGDVFEKLAQTARKDGAFDLCFDCVSSHDARDTAVGYETRIRDAAPAILIGAYITIGGVTRDWIRAGVKRTFGVNLFPKDRDLFWIRLPKSAEGLDRLRTWVDEGRLRPKVNAVFPFDDEGVQAAFRELLSRRAVGKVVVQVDAAAT